MDGASVIDSSSDDEEHMWQAIRQVECRSNSASTDPATSPPGPLAPGVGVCNGFKRQKSCSDFTEVLEDSRKKMRVGEDTEQPGASSTGGFKKKTKLEEYKEQQFLHFLEGYKALATPQQSTVSTSNTFGRRAPFKEFLQSRGKVREMSEGQ